MADVKLVLFDCDGTLFNSVAIIQNCMEETFAEYKYPRPSEDETRLIIGLSLNQAIATLLNRSIDHEIEEMVTAYKRHYLIARQNIAFDEPLYSGIRELLFKLNADPNFILGMVTGKSRRGVKSICERHQLDCFVTIRTADDCPSKPDPAMVSECCFETGIDANHCFVIGDSIYDMQMAKTAGATAIGVSWGYNSVDALINAGAQYILAKPEDLIKIIETDKYA